jgi:hypothetical protein
LAVAVRGNSVYVAGVFRSPGATFGTIYLGGRGNFDIFVTKLTDNGTSGSFVWAQDGGGQGDEYVSAMEITGAGIYLAGNFGGYYNSTTATFGSTTLTSASVGETDIFVAKLTDAGTSAAFVWAQRAGGPDFDYVQELAVRGTAVYITGGFRGATATFGSTVVTNAGAAGQVDAFLAKVTDAGNAGSFAWALPAGGPGRDESLALFFNNNTISVSGVASLPAVFGSLTLANPSGRLVPFLATVTDATLTGLLSGTATGFALYPNPGHGSTVLQLPRLLGKGTLTVLDAMGRTLLTQPVAGPVAELNLRGLAPGLYQVRVQAGGQQLKHNLVVE